MIINAECGKPLVIGIGGEDQVTAVTFDISAWVEAYGTGSVQLVHRRSVDPDATPVPVTFADGIVTWPITAADTAYQGVGEAQLIYTPVNRTKKSEIFQTVVDRALTSPAEVPIPLRGWVQQVLETAEATVEETEELAEAAAASAAEAAESARHLTIDDTLTQQGQAADAAATGDKFRNAAGGVINGLLSAAPFTTFNVGGYNFSNGYPNDLTNRIRTVRASVDTSKRIACIAVAPGYKFGVIVHTGAGAGVYYGAWDGVKFYTDAVWQTGPVFFGNIDKNAGYRYSVVIAKADDSSISTSDGPDALKVYFATDANLETAGVPADAKAVGDAIAAISQDESQKIHDYYFTDDYLEDRVATIREIMSTVSNAGDSFIFFTDPHYYAANGNVQNGMQTTPIMAYLMKQLNIGWTVCGGDLYDSFYTNKGNAQECFSKYRNFMDPIWDKSYYIIGNHEFNNADNAHPQNQLSRAFIYQSTAKDKERQFGDLEPHTNAYYIDNTAQKIRYFFLPAESYAWISIDAVTWFAKQLESVPDGYTVVVLSHIGLMHENGDADDPGFANLVLPQIDPENPTAGGNRWAHVWGAMDAAKAHTTYTIDNTTYDYTGKDFEVACAITGHTHVDDYAVTTGGIPIVCVVLDRAGRTSAEKIYGHTLRVCRKIGTIAEQAFDVVHIDTSVKKIYMTRIGGCVLNAVLDIPEDKKSETNPGQYATSVVDANDPYYDPDTGTIGDNAVRYNATSWVLHSIDEGYCDREFSY